MQTERFDSAAQSIDMNVQAFGVKSRAPPPPVLPNIFGRNDPFGVTSEPRHDQELLTRKLQRMSAEADVVILVLDAQVPVIVNVQRPAPSEIRLRPRARCEFVSHKDNLQKC